MSPAKKGLELENMQLDAKKEHSVDKRDQSSAIGRPVTRGVLLAERP